MTPEPVQINVSAAVRGQRLLDHLNRGQRPDRKVTVDEVLDVTRGVGDPPYLLDPDWVGLMERHEPTLREMIDIHSAVREQAWKAYAPLRSLAHYERPCPEDDMREMITQYVDRTAPTDNERCITSRDEHGNAVYGIHTVGMVSLAAVGGGALVESSDYPGYQPGWWSVQPVNAMGSRLPHVIVHRVYPEGDSRDLRHLCRTWYHPSREYALDVARQIMQGEVPVFGWCNTTAEYGLRGFTRAYCWNRLHPSRITSVDVYRSLTLSDSGTVRDLVTVDRAYLRERGYRVEE